MGRDGVQRWVGAEFEVALNRHLTPRNDAERLRIHPVLLPGVSPDAIPPFLALFQVEQWSPDLPLPPGLCEALKSGQQRFDQTPHFEGCPFMGLAVFRRQDAALFFGRRVETLKALAGLGDQQENAPELSQRGDSGNYRRWLQVEGSSGAGKSSLVLAGLLPLVERGALWPRTGLQHWRVLGLSAPI